jgi:hypothetical protein
MVQLTQRANEFQWNLHDSIVGHGQRSPDDLTWAGLRAYIKQLLGCSWPMPLGLVQAIQASGQAWAYFEGSMVKLGRAGLGAMF